MAQNYGTMTREAIPSSSSAVTVRPGSSLSRSSSSASTHISASGPYNKDAASYSKETGRKGFPHNINQEHHLFADEERHSTDESPLLNHGPHHNQDIGHGNQVGPSAGFWSCTINLANTILGTGMLAMPSALAAVGLLLGSFMIVFSALASSLGLYFLTRSASKTHGRSASFFACSKLTYPSAAVWFDLAIAIKCFGVGISYLIIIGDLMPEVVRSLSMMAFAAAGADGSGEMDPNLWFLVDRRFWITIFMGIIAPLSFLKKLDSLKATSALALGAVVYLVFIVIYYYVDPNQPMPPREEIRLVHLTPQFLTTLPIFVFAFTCHQNIFSVYNELTDNGQSMLNRIISTSIGSAAVVYHIIGVLGYLTFGNIVGSNIILMYNTGLLVTIGRIAMVILVMFSFPLQCHPCRACLDKVLNSIVSFWNSTRFGNNGKYDNLSTITEVDDDGQHEAEPEHHDDHGAGPAQSNFKYIVMTLCILIGSYLIAITVSTLELVLSLVGSTGSTAISFILPGFFYYKLHINDRWDVRKVLSVCLIVYGFMVMTICLSANIRRIVNG